MQLEFIVTAQTLKRADSQKPVANSRGYLKTHFKLPIEYTGTITAVFGKFIDGVMYSIPMTVSDTGFCDVPDEILEHKAREDFTLEVWLSSADMKYIPTNHVSVLIHGSGGGGEVDPLPYSADNQYQEIARMYKEIMDKLENPGNSGEPKPGPAQADSYMPKLFLEGDISTATKDIEVLMDFEYKSSTDNFYGACTIKWQGTSSIAYPKKNFTIKLYTDSTKKNKLKKSMHGWSTQNKFCLKANYIDHSQARNIVSAKIWGDIVATRRAIPELMKTSVNYGAIDGFPIQLYINGKSQGLYTWNIPKDGWQFNMNDEVNTHTILCAEIHDGAGAFRSNALIDGTDWSLEFPENLSPAILTSFNNVINHVKDTTDAVFVVDFENYLDLEACIDYYIYAFVMCHLDGLGKNMLMATYDGTKWFPSMYDMDSTWGLYFDGSSFVSYAYLFPNEYQCSNSLLWERLYKNYSQEIYDRFMELKKGPLSIGNLMARFESFTNTIPEKYYLEEAVLWPDIPNSEKDQSEQIKEFIIKRSYYTESIIESFVQKNLFNAKLVDANYYIDVSNGNEIADGSYYTSFYIPVIEGQNYTISDSGWSRIAYYDKNENFLIGEEGNSPLTSFAPSNTRLARITIPKSFIGTARFEKKEI